MQLLTLSMLVAGLFMASGFAYGDGDIPCRERSRLLPSDMQINGYFGAGLAMDQGYAVVGSNEADGILSDEGAAYVFNINDISQPIQVSKIVADDGLAGDDFGLSIALQWPLCAIGAIHDDDLGVSSGSVYLFDVSNPSSPVQLAKVLASDGTEQDLFGSEIQLAGNLLAVSAIESAGAVRDETGSVYLFDISDPFIPVEVAKVSAGDGRSGDRFGVALDIQANILVVGADGNDEGGSSAGAVYLFDLSNLPEVVEREKIIPEGIDDRERFGIAVSIDGTVLGVGSLADDGGSGSGAVYLLDVSGPGPATLLSKVVASDAAERAGFGRTMAIAGDLLVSSAWDDGDNGHSSGALYVIDISDPVYPVELGKMYASDGVQGDNMGEYFVHDGHHVLSGAWRKSHVSPDVVGAGSAYLFDLDACQGDSNFDGQVDVNDISEVLGNLGQSCGFPGGCAGDVDCNSKVDVNDISYVLFRLGDDCQ